jgi:ribosome biogenesis protein SSF1/2
MIVFRPNVGSFALFQFILNFCYFLPPKKMSYPKIRRGKTELEVVELVSDVRKMMRPYTAVRLKEDAKNRKMKLNDYATKLSSALGVSHLLAFSQNESRIYARIARCPTGPTLTFQIQQFSLTKHVVASQKRPYYTPSLYDHPPLVVSNNFGDTTAAPHIKLMRITFQALFPAINVATLNLTDCKRVVLFNLIRRRPNNERNNKNTEHTIGDGVESTNRDGGEHDDDQEEFVEVRHYGIKASPVGVDRRVRRLIQANAPNLGRCQDISEYILGSKGGADASNSSVGSITAGAMSDSEAEDETSHVVLPQRYLGRGNAKHQKAALKLVELGPRLCLKLVKIERGLASGDVMYHAFQTKTPEEVNAQRLKLEQAAQLKKQRREQQEANVAQKKRLREASVAKKKRKNHDGTASSVPQDDDAKILNGEETDNSGNDTDEDDNYSDYSGASLQEN